MEKKEFDGFLVFLAVGVMAAILSAAGVVVNWGKKILASHILIWLTAALSVLWLITGYRAARNSAVRPAKPKG